MALLPFSKSKFLSSSWDCSIKVWHLDTPQFLNSCQFKSVPTRLCQINTNQVACGFENGEIGILNRSYLSIIKTFKAHAKKVTCMKLSMDYKLISGSKDGTIRISESSNHANSITINLHQDSVTCLEVTASNQLISGSNDCTIRMWDIQTGDCLNMISMKAKVLCIQLMLSDLIAVGLAANSDNLKILDASKKLSEVHTIHGHSTNVNGMDFVPELNQLVSFSSNDSIKLWQI
jgi:WD40 repeat protein